MFLGTPDFLQRIVTAELLNSPPTEVAKFAQPSEGGYGLNMLAFRQADAAAHSRMRTPLRLGTAVTVLGSGVVGFLGMSWFGLILPIVNIFIMQRAYLGSTLGPVDNSATARAAEHVQILALILYRWRAKSPREAAEWLETEPQIRPLWDVLTALQTHT